MPDTAQPAAQRFITAEDLLAFTWVSDVQLAPDGSRVAWVQTTIDREKNEYRSHIWMASTSAGGWPGLGAPVQFTNGPKRDTAPRWSPDGRWLAFLSERNAPGSKENKDDKPRPQLWVIPAGGGEARPLTNLKHGAGAAVWSPDGSRIAFVAKVGPKGLERVGEGDDDPKDYARKYNKDVRVITRIHYKLDGTGYFDEKRSHLVVIPFQPDLGPKRFAEPVQLTAGEFDVRGPAWSPDGCWLAFASNTHPDADYQRWTDIYVVPAERPADGPVAPEPVTKSQGYVWEPQWSPDGRWIAYLARDRELDWYANTRLWAVPVAGGRAAGDPVCLTADWDRPVGDESLSDMREYGPASVVVWSPDGRELLFHGSDHGTVQLYAVPGPDAPSGGTPGGGPRRVRQLTAGERVIYDYSFSRDLREVALLSSDELTPGDVWVARYEPPASGGDGMVVDERRVTRVNEALFSGIRLSKPERFTFTSDGLDLEGWVLRPAAFEPGRKYPAVLQIHGGPMAMYGAAFFHEFQLLAARGFAVVYSNPRGSQGYGEAFCAAIRGDWGNKDYADVMACIHAAVERFDFIDASRLGCAGGSYGGFMTNWIVTHTDEFRAAVTMRSVVNEATMFGCSDFGFHSDRDLGGPPWEVPQNYARVSPITYVANCRTPLLIIHSEMDLRCPIEQAEQLYTALKYLRVPTEFVRFPNESHGLSRSGQPWHRVFRLNKIVEWFTKYLSDEAPPAGETEAAR